MKLTTACWSASAIISATTRSTSAASTRDYRKLQDGLIVVKAAIQRANLPVHEDILQLGELKHVIQMLSGLNTKNGSEPGFNGVEFRYSAVILKPEVLGIIRDLEAQIDAIQDKLNEFNAATRIEIPAWILDLAR